jgi:hypothetical protein
MSEMTAKQKTMVKARKAARAAFALLILGGAVVFLYGILTSYFPTILNGIVLFASSSLPFATSKIIEKKLKPTLGV